MSSAYRAVFSSFIQVAALFQQTYCTGLLLAAISQEGVRCQDNLFMPNCFFHCNQLCKDFPNQKCVYNSQAPPPIRTQLRSFIGSEVLQVKTPTFYPLCLQCLLAFLDILSTRWRIRKDFLTKCLYNLKNILFKLNQVSQLRCPGWDKSSELASTCLSSKSIFQQSSLLSWEPQFLFSCAQRLYIAIKKDHVTDFQLKKKHKSASSIKISQGAVPGFSLVPWWGCPSQSSLNSLGCR